MSVLTVHIDGIGFWGNGLPGLDALDAFLIDGVLPEQCPARPQPELLAPNERRRAPGTVALALDVALAACEMAGRQPSELASVFASTHGDLAITDYMCQTLAESPTDISPTKFHNSVHNAAAGYWTIGSGCMAAATAVSAWGATVAQGLLESAVQVRIDGGPVLLVAYDIAGSGPLGTITRSEGLLGFALVLVAERGERTLASLDLRVRDTEAATAPGQLLQRYAGNAMAPGMPLLELLARHRLGLPCARQIQLHAGPGSALEIGLHA